MKTAREVLNEKYEGTCTRLKDMDIFFIEEAMKEYALEILQQFIDNDYRLYEMEWAGSDDYGGSCKGNLDKAEFEKFKEEMIK